MEVQTNIDRAERIAELIATIEKTKELTDYNIGYMCGYVDASKHQLCPAS